MKSLITLIIIAVGAIYFSPSVPPPPEGDRERPGFAVIELFTSEGCSSCPPADALIEKIRQQQAGKLVYILAFHVDYWNHLGWKDVFSEAAYTDRQRRYANWLNLESVYTPQLVVNGRSEYVGSDEGAITKAIGAALALATSDTVTLRAAVANDQININYQVPPNQKGELVLALVQKVAQSQVWAGENAGKQLTHLQIVRQLVYMNIAHQNNVTMKTPAGFRAKDWELIGFVQNKTKGAIVSAGRAGFQL